MRLYEAVVLLATVLQLVAAHFGIYNETPWIWGGFPKNKTETNGTNKTLPAHQDPCPPYKSPPMPNFRAADRSISQTKCYEYIWQLKNREDETLYKKKICGIKPLLFIMGGAMAKLGEYPHMGAIGWKAKNDTWLFMCGSSLISNKFVLTAAHCSSVSINDDRVSDIKPKIVRFGVTITSDINMKMKQVIDYGIDEIIVHPKYASPKRYFDIALMKLDSEVIFTKAIQPACLWNDFNVSLHADKAEVAGWGAVQSGVKKMSRDLFKAKVDLINSEECDRLLYHSRHRNWNGVFDHQICAGKLNGGVDACQGDSGGPLMVKIPFPKSAEGNMYHVLGVTSFGIGCGEKNVPGVYTRVSSFLEWIEPIVWG